MECHTTLTLHVKTPFCSVTLTYHQLLYGEKKHFRSFNWVNTSYIQGSSTVASKTHETSTLFVVKHIIITCIVTDDFFFFIIKPNFIDIIFAVAGNILKKQKRSTVSSICNNSIVKLLLVTIIINYDIHISIREGFLGMLFQQYFSPKNPIECLLGFTKSTFTWQHVRHISVPKAIERRHCWFS